MQFISWDLLFYSANLHQPYQQVMPASPHNYLFFKITFNQIQPLDHLFENLTLMLSETCRYTDSTSQIANH